MAHTAQPRVARAGRVLRPWSATRQRRSVPGMALVRALLLAIVALVFVTTVSLVFIQDTGFLEKLVLVAVAVVLAISVPRIQRLGRRAPR
jgi:hypothetical protein